MIRNPIKKFLKFARKLRIFTTRLGLLIFDMQRGYYEIRKSKSASYRPPRSCIKYQCERDGNIWISSLALRHTYMALDGLVIVNYMLH